jgi:hypothetical protein
LEQLLEQFHDFCLNGGNFKLNVRSIGGVDRFDGFVCVCVGVNYGISRGCFFANKTFGGYATIAFARTAAGAYQSGAARKHGAGGIANHSFAFAIAGF